MIKISILYPNEEGAWFDVSYYVGTHVPLSIKLLGAHPGYQGVTVEHGVSGLSPGSQPPYRVLCHFLFDSVDDFMAAFQPNAATLRGDMPNYTDIEPIVQFNEVLISQ